MVLSGFSACGLSFDVKDPNLFKFRKFVTSTEISQFTGGQFLDVRVHYRYTFEELQPLHDRI